MTRHAANVGSDRRDCFADVEGQGLAQCFAEMDMDGDGEISCAGNKTNTRPHQRACARAHTHTHTRTRTREWRRPCSKNKPRVTGLENKQQTNKRTGSVTGPSGRPPVAGTRQPGWGASTHAPGHVPSQGGWFRTPMVWVLRRVGGTKGLGQLPGASVPRLCFSCARWEEFLSFVSTRAQTRRAERGGSRNTSSRYRHELLAKAELHLKSIRDINHAIAAMTPKADSRSEASPRPVVEL